MSQSDMAIALQIGVSGYGKIEAGKIKLSTDRLEQIARIFGMQVQEIISFNEEEFLVQRLNLPDGSDNSLTEILSTPAIQKSLSHPF